MITVGSPALARTIRSGGSGGTGVGGMPLPRENATGRHQAAHAAFSPSTAVVTAVEGEPGGDLSAVSLDGKLGGIEVLGTDGFTFTGAATQAEGAALTARPRTTVMA